MLCQAAKADNLSLVSGETLSGECLVVSPGPAVIDIGMDGYATSRGKQTKYLDVLRVHQPDEVIEDYIDTILVESAMVAETEKVEFQALALDHSDVGNIADPDLGEIRLPGNRAQRSELRAIEPHPIITTGMHVLEGLKDLGSVIHLISGLVAKSLKPFFLPVFHIIKYPLS